MSIHKTAMGKPINMDRIRLENETTIAIGNMNTNARGDELGPGGQIIKTRAQIMQEYYALNTQVADDTPLDLTNFSSTAPTITADENILVTSSQEETPVIIPEDQKDISGDLDGGVDSSYVKPRGSLANTIAQSTEVQQKIINPKRDGLRRL